MLDRLSSSFFKYVLNHLAAFNTILLIIFFYLTSNLNAQEIKLKDSYLLDSHVVTLKDLNISDSKKIVFILDKDKVKWSIPTFKVINKLKELGYTTKREKNRNFINFELKVKNRFPELEEFIKSKYEEFYPTINIDSINIKPTSSKITDIILNHSCDIRLSKNYFRKKSSSFSVSCSNKKLFFRYEVNATIKVYKANHQIKKDKIIDKGSIYQESIEFKNFYMPPVWGNIIKKYIAKQNISKGKILTFANIEPLPKVLKNSRVKCFYKDGALTIELDAISLQNGNIGDTIRVKKSNGKVLKGVVVGVQKVELK